MPIHLPIATDATFTTVFSGLAKPIEFIVRAHNTIRKYERDQGPVVVRLGVSKLSKGKRPNYRIDSARTGKLIAAIDGNTHESWGDQIDSDGDWSSVTMTYAEILVLYTKVREMERTGKNPFA